MIKQLNLIGIFFVFLAVCVSSSFGLVGNNCTFDYQCGEIPYEVCSSSSSSSSSLSCTLIPGLGVDENTNKIYFLGRCGGVLPPSGISNNPGTVYVFSANLDGTAITPLTSLSEDTGLTSPTYSVVWKFFAISPFDFFIIRLIRDAIAFDFIDRNTFNESAVFIQRDNPEISLDFDLTTGKTYSCYFFEVVVFPTIVTNPLFETPDTVLYPASAFNGSDFCTNVKVVGDNLYILAGDSVYLGSVNGSQPLQLLFTTTSLSGYYLAFSADSSAVYFTTEFSVDRFFVNGQVGPTLLFPDHTPSPNFTTLQVLKDELYFDDGAFIRRVNTTSLSTDDLIPFQFSYTGGSGECACRSGFSGDNCQTCENGQVQWSNSTPSCVPILANSSFPSQCSEDYQCGNVPYTICDGNQCKCRGSFSGNLCTLCSGLVSWNQGIPECISTSENNNNSSSSENCSISQTLRTQWISNGDNFYLYDITIHNSGSQDIITAVFSIDSIGTVAIAQSWSLVLYANTIPTTRLASLFPNTLISAESDYTASGYINQGNQTTLVLVSCSA